MDWSTAYLMLLGMGIFHGINPGMGWLFAVGLGLQEQRRSAVWTALLPLAAGHALAVGFAILVFGLLGAMLPPGVLKWSVATVLLVFGVYRLFRSGHPRYGGMQVRARELAAWSFLMATAHGAGLMVLPFVFGAAAFGAPADHAGAVHAGADHGGMEHAGMDHGGMEHAGMDYAAHHASLAADTGVHQGHAELLMTLLPQEPIAGLVATLIHTVGYLAIMGAAAVLVYEKFGLRMLRKAWVNLDLIWAAALIITALLTPFI